MPGELDPETIARLVARNGSLRAAAEGALTDPQFAPELRALGATQMSMKGVDGALVVFWWWPPEVDGEVWRLVAARDLLDGEAVTPNPSVGATSKRPPYRPREAFPPDKTRRLHEELEKRAAAGNPRRGPLTQSAIALRLGFERHRIPQAIALLKVGWDLSESHPDFSANDGVRWPTPEEVLQLRGS